MDPGSSCSKSISVCESSSGSMPHEAEIVAHVKGQTSDSASTKVLIEEGEGVSKEQQGRENDSRNGKDVGVRRNDIGVHEEVVDNVAVVSCNEAESDTTTKEKPKEFHMVDLSGGGGERICRICHFGSDQSPKASDNGSGSSKSTSPDLIEIGCKCKNELGLAHFHCAEAWFKLKGNSVCEICGCTAKNVTVSSREGWSEVRDNTSDERRRRGRGQSCCIFIAFLLTIVLLHWFFKKFSFYYKST